MMPWLKESGPLGPVLLVAAVLLLFALAYFALRSAEAARWREAQSGWTQLGDPADDSGRRAYWEAVAKAFYLPMLLPLTPAMREQALALTRRVLGRPELLSNERLAAPWRRLEQALLDTAATGERPLPSVVRDVRGSLTELIRSS